jgi:hypothetical protein
MGIPAQGAAFKIFKAFTPPSKGRGLSSLLSQATRSWNLFLVFEQQLIHNNYFNNTKNAEVRLQIRTTKSMKAKRTTSSLSRLPFHPRSGRLMTKTGMERSKLLSS